MLKLALLSALAAQCSAQLLGNRQPETRPFLGLRSCLKDFCTVDYNLSLVIDANNREAYDITSNSPCIRSNKWNLAVCSNPTICGQTCALDGADSSKDSSVISDGNELTLSINNSKSSLRNGFRVFMLDTLTETYTMFRLLNREFTFTVDVSDVPCGVTASLFFVQMDSDGGKHRSHQRNLAGAARGTGYCDAMFPTSMHFVDGLGNIDNQLAQACQEMDVFKGNSYSHAMETHACAANNPVCTSSECDKSLCDMSGCFLDPFPLNSFQFYGPRGKVHTTRPFTVGTQFITHNNQDDGNLVEIRRFYEQDGERIAFPSFSLDQQQFDSLTETMCRAEKEKFRMSQSNAGLFQLGEAMRKGMVLAFSLASTETEHYGPPQSRDVCAQMNGDEMLRVRKPMITTKFSDIRVAEIMRSPVDPILLGDNPSNAT